MQRTVATPPNSTCSALDSRQNNFGFLRLLFATLVIFGHSPELIDGNRSRELATRVFGTLSLGELAVDGFFLISGYLVTKSYLQTNDAKSYLFKRILRIYPGYIVAYFFSLLIVGYLAGGDLSSLLDVGIFRQIINIARLGTPYLPGAFNDLSYPSLNGSLWTIFYEFGSYIGIMILGLIGLLQKRRWFLLVTAALLITSAMLGLLQPFQHLPYIFATAVRFMAIFNVGAIFFLYRDTIVYDQKLALAAVVLLPFFMFSPLTAEITLTIFGGYVLFWFALSVGVNSLSLLDNKADISYGLYLYAWPIQNLTISIYSDISPIVLSCVTLIIAGALGYLSWKLVESPFLQLKT